MVRTRRTVGRVAVLGLLALLMSACLKLDMNLEVSSDDTVSGTIVFAVQKELLDIAGGSVEDILGTDAPLPSDVPGVTVSDYEDDEFAGQQFTFDSVPLAEFNSEEPDALQIVREGDVFMVTGVLDLSTGLTGPTGLTGLDPEQFLQGAQLQITISFPGEVTETNGQADGNSVTWVPEVGERLELQATASAVDGGSDSNLLLWLIIAGVVVVLAIVTAVVLSRRKGGAAADTVGTETPAASPAASSPDSPVPPPPPPPTDQP